MSEKKEQALNEITTSFREMANLVLKQLTSLEKLMTTSDDQDFKSAGGTNEGGGKPSRQL